jgi:hypothetical protein
MKSILSITLLFSLVSCATNDVQTQNPFNAVTLKEKIIEGKTTQNEVLETFGAPEITTLDESKEEVWTYAKHSQESESKGLDTDMLGVFMPSPFRWAWVDVNYNKHETASKATTVSIRFNKSKIVKSYIISRSKV